MCACMCVCVCPCVCACVCVCVAQLRGTQRKKKEIKCLQSSHQKPMWKPNIRHTANLWRSAFLLFSHSPLLMSSLPEPLLKLPHLKTISSPEQTDQPAGLECVCVCMCVSLLLSRWGAEHCPLTLPHRTLPKTW